MTSLCQPPSSHTTIYSLSKFGQRALAVVGTFSTLGVYRNDVLHNLTFTLHYISYRMNNP